MSNHSLFAETLSGVLERIVFFNEENHYCIGEFRPADEKETVTITGNLPSVQCGETLDLVGQWKKHAQYGRQFQISSFTSRLPADVYGIRKYLGSGLVPGIGKVYAEKIVDHFGTKTLHVISHESARLKEVPGIGIQRAKSIKKAWDEQSALREVMMFLKNYGIGTAQCLKLVKNYGNEAKNIVRDEPYRIAREIDGIGFKTADKIALNLGFSNDGVPRVQAGILFALNELEEIGHTCYLSEDLVAYTAELLKVEMTKGSGPEIYEVSHDTIRHQIEELMVQNELKANVSGAVQTRAQFNAETQIAKALFALQSCRSGLPMIIVPKAVEWAQEKAGFVFAPEQSEAVSGALENKLSILTGGPGTGKTTILRALVAILKAKKVRVVLAAPTGRAAQRMGSAAQSFALTIHRLLQFDPAEGRFVHGEDNPLRADFVIVDEASMLDSRLAAALIRAVPASAHLLLVGDTHQLPSVGAGNVLSDLIESELFHVVRLQKIFRQGNRSSIVTTAHNILQGIAGAPNMVNQAQDMDPQKDLHFIRVDDAEMCVARIQELISDYLPRTLGVNPIKDVQVLAPMHKGTAGIGRINTDLQKTLNPATQSISYGTQRFAVGDKLIQTKNNYEKNIFNGDIGFIVALKPETGMVSVDFDGAVVEFERAELAHLQSAYVISIHKSQGSEFPVVVIPLLKQHFIMLQRNLLYTAITRGRKKVFIVGDPVAYAMAVNNTESTTRLTALKEKIKAYFVKE